jgi:hypothetical protein
LGRLVLVWPRHRLHAPGSISRVEGVNPSSGSLPSSALVRLQI